MLITLLVAVVQWPHTQLKHTQFVLFFEDLCRHKTSPISISSISFKTKPGTLNGPLNFRWTNRNVLIFLVQCLFLSSLACRRTNTQLKHKRLCLYFNEDLSRHKTFPLSLIYPKPNSNISFKHNSRPLNGPLNIRWTSQNVLIFPVKCSFLSSLRGM